MIKPGTPSNLTDEIVYNASCNGDRFAQEKIIEYFLARVYVVIAAQLGRLPNERGSIEDLTQDIVMSVLEHLESLRIPTAAGLKSYTSTIIDNKLADYRSGRSTLSRDKVRGMLTIDWQASYSSSAGQLLHSLVKDQQTPSKIYRHTEEVDLLMRALARLTPDHRRVIELCWLRELKTAEAAETMGRTRPATAMLLQRAIIELRSAVAIEEGKYSAPSEEC